MEPKTRRWILISGALATATVIGVAGAVRGGVVNMTNLGWTLVDPDLERDLNIPNVALINDMVAHGDTGCYTMLMFAPTEQLMHNYSGMGLGGGTGSGIYSAATGTILNFGGGSHTLDAATTLSGAGTVRASAGTLVFDNGFETVLAGN